MKLIAQIISWLFLPFLAPVYALILTFYVEVEEKELVNMQNLGYLTSKGQWMILVLFLMLSVLGPGMVILLMKFRGMISSVHMEKKEERIVPAVMVNFFAAMLTYFLWIKVPADFPGKIYLMSLALGSWMSVIAAVVITRKWKISLHALGMGILTGFIFGYFQAMSTFPVWLIPTLIFISGIVCAMRVYLKAHSLEQTLVGFTLGFTFLWLTCYIFGTYTLEILH